MPITDTSFIEAMKAKQSEKLAKLMQNITDSENIERKLAVVILAAGLGKFAGIAAARRKFDREIDSLLIKYSH